MSTKENGAVKSRRLSRKWKTEGRCSHCGGERDNELYVTCTECRKKNQIAQRHLKAKREAQKMCYRCGKVKVQDGYKTCEDCSKKAYAYHKRDPKARARAKAKYQKVKDELFQAYGGYCCACCGETEPMFLCIDHIDGNGEKHRTSIGVGTRGRNMYTWLKKNDFPLGFQVLCYNCNMGKYLNNGTCPHSTTRNQE